MPFQFEDHNKIRRAGRILAGTILHRMHCQATFALQALQ